MKCRHWRRRSQLQQQQRHWSWETVVRWCGSVRLCLCIINKIHNYCDDIVWYCWKFWAELSFCIRIWLGMTHSALSMYDTIYNMSCHAMIDKKDAIFPFDKKALALLVSLALVYILFCFIPLFLLHPILFPFKKYITRYFMWLNCHLGKSEFKCKSKAIFINTGKIFQYWRCGCSIIVSSIVACNATAGRNITGGRKLSWGTAITKTLKINTYNAQRINKI